MTNAKKTHWFRNTLITLIICGIIGTVLAGVLFFGPERGKTTASASIQFSFDGAADGKGPNGVPLSMDALTSDEVLTEALAATGLADTVSAEMVRPCITVTGVYPENLVKQVTSYDSLLDFTGNRELTISEFHPTLFTATLENSFDPSISRAKLEELLWNTLEAFRMTFIKHYSFAPLHTSDLGADLTAFDYAQLLQVLEESIRHHATYAEEMYEKEPFFRLNGRGFEDIYVQLNSLIEGDIARFNSNITINALTRDTARLLSQYQYEIRDLNNELSKQQDRLKKLDGLIAAYDKNEIIYLSTADSLTKIDGNSSETYDALVTEQKEVSDGITEINSRITTYQLKLSDLLKGFEGTGAAGTQIQATGSVVTAAAEGDEAGDAAEAAEAVATDVTESLLTDEEIAAAAKAAEAMSTTQMDALENDLRALMDKHQKIADEFEAMLKAYNGEELNEVTVNIYGYKYNTPKVLSGAFIKQVIKTAGPICALGFMVCMIGLIRSRKKETV